MLVTVRSHLLMLILAVIVPALAGASWLVLRTIDAEREASARMLRDTARTMSLMVDQELSQRAAIARVLAQSRWLDDGDAIAPLALLHFRDMARRGMQGLHGWVELHDAEHVLLDTRLRPNARPRALTTSDRLSGGHASHPPASLAARGGSDAAIVAPVVRDGRLLFHVLVGLPASQLQRVIDSQQLSPDAIGAVLDRQGRLVAYHPVGSSPPSPRVAEDMRAQLTLGREGYFQTVSALGQPSMAFFSTSPQGWTYVSGVTQERYDDLFSETVRHVMLGALGLLSLGCAGAWWIARRIAKPVEALKTAAGCIRAGRPVRYAASGIVECDKVGCALADASMAMRDNRDLLEHQVQEAVGKTRLAEQRAAQTQRIGALGRLTGGVAHEFNNLLGVISNSIHLAQRHPLASELQGPIATILRAVEAGSQLTQHLLRFAGRRPVRPQVLHLGQFLPELHPMVRSVLGRHIDIVIEVDRDTRPLRVDPGELELSLINLCLNARDAMRDGGKLRIHASNADALDTEDLPPLEAPRCWVLITVSDDGGGLAPELAARAFEPFFTTKEPGQGTGLGLAQVHGFCAQAGGAARLASTSGLGTTVSLLLPSSEPLTPAVLGDQPPWEELPPVAGLRVLLVEDNADLAGATTALLQSHGALVTRVGDGLAAKVLLRAGTPFDVMLSDVLMPGSLGGHALARWVQHARPGLAVVLISGFHTEQGDHGIRVLSKPCAPEELLKALRDAVAEADARPLSVASPGGSG